MPRKTRSNQTSTLQQMADLLTPPAPADVEESIEMLAVRHLSVEHLGRWIDIPARPITAAESAIGTPAGRLVGIRVTPRGGAGARPDVAPTRTLLLQSGTHTEPFRLTLDQPVHVAPRAWS